MLLSNYGKGGSADDRNVISGGFGRPFKKSRFQILRVLKGSALYPKKIAKVHLSFIFCQQSISLLASCILRLDEAFRNCKM